MQTWPNPSPMGSPLRAYLYELRRRSIDVFFKPPKRGNPYQEENLVENSNLGEVPRTKTPKARKTKPGEGQPTKAWLPSKEHEGTGKGVQGQPSHIA